MMLEVIWHPGEEWPDKADDDRKDEAVVQIYSSELGRGYITSVPTHGMTNPFIDCYDDNITWAYMRDIEAGLIEENRYWQQYGREHKPKEQEKQQAEVVAITQQQPQLAEQLFFDFG